ncbi:DUF3622 domain-containing protein [Ferrimonas balearica]|uniref:DUF3622 domain-containing protein n=1 Tax=Ferrimonas balearica TaxID=44012 RepID=UPI001C99D868|nr:DUF3622 domain-containing protein [Ferrimonas balearica]MBY5992341.1 DUF3622 domain-containing protein [Ferrimonas balearica]
MAQGKKYELRVVDNGGEWTAEIVRKISNRKSKVTQHQAGFGSEAEARQWGEQTLASFQQQQAQRNERKAVQRTEREAQALRQAAKKQAEREAKAQDEDDEFDQ